MTPSERAPGSTTASDVVGIVPASGASSRMGTPKGLLRLAGRTFARRVVEALVEGGCDRAVVVVRAGDEATAREARAAGAEIMENPDPGEGPITSLRLALERLPGDVRWVVWLPLDHPRVRGGTVRALVEAMRAAEGRDGTGAGAGAGGEPEPPVLALPLHGGERGHPAVFGRAVFAELLDPDVDGGARTVVHRHLDAGTVLLVETDDPGVLVDVDTPEEYEALVRGDAP
jgi:molybdenum cofactor cytidylyltransferase